MKRILVIGASGLIGSNIVKLLEKDHEVISASLNNPEFSVDIANEESIKDLLEKVSNIDAIICTAGVANFASWQDASSDEWHFGLNNKLMGQINLIRFGRQYVNTGGVILLTTGILAQYPMAGSGIVSTVNAGLEAAIKTCEIELDSSIRIGAISPGWVKETMEAMGLDSSPGLPAEDVAQVYTNYLVQGEHGQIIQAVKNSF